MNTDRAARFEEREGDLRDILCLALIVALLVMPMAVAVGWLMSSRPCVHAATERLE